MKIFILGAGTWGTALGGVLHDNGHEVVLWHVEADVANEMEESRINPNLPKYRIPHEIRVTHNFNSAKESDIILITVPCQFIRNVLKRFPPTQNNAIFVFGSKGIENKSLSRISQIIHQETLVDENRIVALSGPSHAEEVCLKLPTAVVSASQNIESARLIQGVFNNNSFRVYANNDIIGVEIGGAVKNVIAIAAGICDGVGYGDNTIAALITRGLTEIMRLGVSLGGKKETFFGLSGLGDLIVTANSSLSRNRYVGKHIGRGKTLSNVLSGMSMVAEGVKTSQSVFDLSKLQSVDMPISEQIFHVLFDDKNPRQAINDLMTRIPIDEKL
ncbi:MAG: NAD(P)H-dependent glycerol-3-phosphate dehydrogenase [Fidelibacterota bacterium]